MNLPTIDECVHCGLCLEACPTFAVTGLESQSPRGRISALRNLEQGGRRSRRIEKALDDCLVCRACESACPAGISMERLMGQHREHRSDERPRGWSARLERFLLREVIGNPERLASTLQLIGAASWILEPLIRALRIPVEMPSSARLSQALRSRSFAKPEWRSAETETIERGSPKEASSEKVSRGRVALFLGCLTEPWCHSEHSAAFRVLVRNGWDVVPIRQQCCGALHRHGGELKLGTELSDRAWSTIQDLDPDYLVSDTAGCAASLTEHGKAPVPVLDTLGLLVQEGYEPPPRLSSAPTNWAVAPPCHQRHTSLSEDGTRAILDALLPHGYQELPPPDHCCGAAGLFVVRNPALSRRIGESALERLRSSAFDGIITANAGCLLRWEHLLGRNQVAHPVTLLDRAYRADAGNRP